MHNVVHLRGDRRKQNAWLLMLRYKWNTRTLVMRTFGTRAEALRLVALCKNELAVARLYGSEGYSPNAITVTYLIGGR